MRGRENNKVSSRVLSYQTKLTANMNNIYSK